MKHTSKALFLLLLVVACTLPATAQRLRGRALERIHAAKVAYITDRLHLSQEESMSFLPIYKEYEAEVISCRKGFLRKYKGVDPDSADDETARQYIDDDLDYQQQMLDIKKKYKARFLKVISSQQLSMLNEAEREFRQLLQERLHDRDRRGHRGEPPPPPPPGR